MKIVVISSTVFPCPPKGYAGLEMVAYHCAKGLAEKGHEVSLIAPDGSECPGVTIIPTGPAGKVDEKSAYSKIWKHLADCEVVIDHSWGKWSYMGKIEGWLSKVPILGVLHAPVPTMFQTAPPVERPCFVCISEDQRRACISHLHVAARTCHNGVDTDFYQPLNVPRTDRYLFLARFSSIKGPLTAIRACQKAGVGLDLVGDTSITQEPALLEECKRLADGKQIRMIGPCTRGEAVFHYSQAKALLHPNKTFAEPFGLAPCEAQLCKTPVIAWENGAMRETIDNGKSGYLVESEEQLVNLLKEDAVSKLDRNYCREWASQFSVTRMVDRYDQLVHEAVEDGGW